MLLARRIGAALLVVAAVMVWFSLEPDDSAPQSADFGPEIAAALKAYDVNNAGADSAPQQEVVNGWAAKDLLTVIARAENAGLSPQPAPMDERIPAELLLLVLGVALIAATTPQPEVQRGQRLPAGIRWPRTYGPPPTRDTEPTSSAATTAAPLMSTVGAAVPRVPAQGPQSASGPGRGRPLILVAAGVVVVLIVAGLIVWASITSPADATCKELASNRVAAAAGEHAQMPDGDLRDDLAGIAQLGADSVPADSDQRKPIPQTITSRQQFVDARAKTLRQVWAVCDDSTVGFPAADSRYYDNVRNDVLEAAADRWDQDGSG